MKFQTKFVILYSILIGIIIGIFWSLFWFSGFWKTANNSGYFFYFLGFLPIYFNLLISFLISLYDKSSHKILSAVLFFILTSFIEFIFFVLTGFGSHNP